MRWSDPQSSDSCSIEAHDSTRATGFCWTPTSSRELYRLHCARRSTVIPTLDNALCAIVWRSSLILGFMNDEALRVTIETRLVIFWSRTRNRLWQKGASSGNRLTFVSAHPDCDSDTLLIVARTCGPVCHRGSKTCFDMSESNVVDDTMRELEATVHEWLQSMPDESYTAKLFGEGRNRIAQKVGEEAVEVVISAVRDDHQNLVNEVADLLYHLVVLLVDAKVSLTEVGNRIRSRARATADVELPSTRIFFLKNTFLR